MTALVPAPEGFQFQGDYRRPEKGDYWLSFSALLTLKGVKAAGPHHFDKRKGNWWPEEDRRIILEKVVVDEPS